MLKWAQTQDGFMDLERGPDDPIGVNWISNSISQTLVHKWRAEEQAILVGSKTVLLDDPELTVRHWHGSNPLRIVLDRGLRIPANSKILNQAAPTLVFNSEKEMSVENISYKKSSRKYCC